MEAWVTIGALVGFAMLAWWARREGATSQAMKEDIESLKRDDEIKETSRATAETAADRRDPGAHGVDDIVQPDRIPDWLKRR